MGVKRAAQRKLEHELGISPHRVPLEEFHYLTRIHYKAACDDTWGEHEIDHILFIQPTAPIKLSPVPNEVAQARFVTPQEARLLLDTAINNEGSDGGETTVAGGGSDSSSGDESGNEETPAGGDDAALRGQLVSPWFRLIAGGELPSWWRAVLAGQLPQLAEELGSDPTIHRLG